MERIERGDNPEKDMRDMPVEGNLSRLNLPEGDRGRRGFRRFASLFFDQSDELRMPRKKTPKHFRIQWELERLHPEIEPLPPTPIAPEAEERLKTWGVPENFITGLQGLVSLFRYEALPLKLDRIVKNGAYLFEDQQGKEIVVLPNFNDYQKRLDGACLDLSLQA